METIQRAKKEDAKCIALLGRITFTEAFSDLFSDPQDLMNYLDSTFGVDKITRSIAKENNVYWIALIDGLPVGYAKLKLNSPTDFGTSGNGSQLQKIYVLQDFLAMKIGKRLQDKLLKKAKENGSEYVWLSVYKRNERAIGFYRKNDFKAIGKHQFTIGRDTFDFMVMAKKLKDK